MKRVDIEALAKKLGSSFEVVALKSTEPGPTAIAGQDTQEKFLVKADTLRAYLSRMRATLFQKERKPFTKRDLELRERIFTMYPRSRSTPLPWSLGQEPCFEVEPRQ